MIANDASYAPQYRCTLRMTMPHDGALRIERVYGNTMLELSRG